MKYCWQCILFLSLAGCASRTPMGDGTAGQEPPAETSKGAGAQNLSTSKSKTKLSPEDASFIRQAVSCGITQVRIGRLAVQRSQEPALKELGERLTAAHARAGHELLDLAARKGLRVQPQTTTEEQEIVQDLSFLAGAEFDRACEREIVKTHAQAIRLFTEEAAHGQDAEVREFAKQMLPVWDEHLQIARHLAPGSLPGTHVNPLRRE